MVGLVAFISISLLSVSQAAPPIQCNAGPQTSALGCLGEPHFIDQEKASKCEKIQDECERITCVVRESGWMDGDKIDKPRFTGYFDQYAIDNPQWQSAVEHMKSACFQTDLPALGVHLNCPAFDASLCIVESFIKHAQPSQWSSTEKCQSVRQFYAVCPYCPEECRARDIPVGSCNACKPLPGRS